MKIDNVLQDNIGYIELQDIMGDDLAIVNAARVSYLGESKGEEKDRKLLHYLWKNRHTSPFEMATIKLKIHCPLFVARQWMRHRTFSYNEVSRRYTAENLQFYSPINWRIQSKDNKQMSTDENIHALDKKLFHYQESMNIGDIEEYIINDARLTRLAVSYYNHLLDLGIAREQARMVLPQSMYTTFIATGNLRNWLHFVELRSHPHAQEEIRLYSDAIRDNIVKERFPWTYEVFMENK